MKFKLPFNSTSYEPEVVAQLESLRHTELSHLQRRLHHPIDIYAIASHEIWDNLNDLLELIDEIVEKQLYLPANSDSKWQKRLIRQLDHTLDAFVQFVDSCRAIIKCCFIGDERDKHTKAIRRFDKAIHDLADKTCHAVNKIKHEQRVLQAIYFHYPGLFIPGYFVEGVVDTEVTGPDPSLHKNSNTAFSLYRSVPMLVCAVYLASAALAHEVRQATKLPPANLGEKRGEQDEIITSVLKKTSLLPLTFFPDEVDMPTPLVRYREHTDVAPSMAELEFPAVRSKPNTVFAGCQVSTSWTVRSVARSFKMPYWTVSDE